MSTKKLKQEDNILQEAKRAEEAYTNKLVEAKANYEQIMKEINSPTVAKLVSGYDPLEERISDEL